MNKKLKLVFEYCSGEQGFALPIAVGMGLVMILISTTLLVRSQGDKVTALAQMNTARSLGLSEVGVTRTQSAFKQNSTLAATPYNVNSATNSAVWTASSLLAGVGAGGWIPVSTFGNYRIVSYVPDNPGTGIGTLEVSGKAPQGAITSLLVQMYTTTGIDQFRIVEWRRKEAP